MTWQKMKEMPVMGLETSQMLWAVQEKARVFGNDTYTVIWRTNIPEDSEKPKMHHLSIKRNDQEPIHDWRDLQAIKTDLLGSEEEAIEMYPAESRVVDMANQYHLFSFEGVKWDWFGFNDGRHVGTPEEAKKRGAKQREKTD